MNIQLPRIIPSQELIEEYQTLYDRMRREKESVDQSDGQGVVRSIWNSKYKNAENVVQTFGIIEEMNRETNLNRYLDWAYRAFSLLASEYDKDGSTSFKGKTALFGKRVQDLKVQLSKRKIDDLARSLFQRLQTWTTYQETGLVRLKISFEPARFTTIKSRPNSNGKVPGVLLRCVIRSDSDERSDTPGVTQSERSETPLSSSTDRSMTPGTLSEGF